MGPDGQSTDESAGEEGPLRARVKVCHVREVLWRSQDYIRIAKFIDRHRRVTNLYGNTPAGTLPHRRIRRGGLVSKIKHVPCGLPINFYDATWYNSLSPFDKNALAAAPEVQIPYFDLGEDD